jgi:hypothetical protein
LINDHFFTPFEDGSFAASVSQGCPPALIVEEAFMLPNVGRIARKNPQEYLPKFIAMILILFIFRIRPGSILGPSPTLC